MIGDILNSRKLVVVRQNRGTACASQTLDLGSPLGRRFDTCVSAGAVVNLRGRSSHNVVVVMAFSFTVNPGSSPSSNPNGLARISVFEVFDLGSKTCPIVTPPTKCSQRCSRFAPSRPTSPQVTALTGPMVMKNWPSCCGSARSIPRRAHGLCPAAPCVMTKTSPRRRADSSRRRSICARSHTSNNYPSSAIRIAFQVRAESRRPSSACPLSADPQLPPDTAWHPVSNLPEMSFDHGTVVRHARNRLAAKLSYTNIGFGLAPDEFAMSTLREIYCAALGYQVDATNLHRVLCRRGVLTATGNTAPSGKSGGRPPALYRFTDSTLRVTDEFAALRPPS